VKRRRRRERCRRLQQQRHILSGSLRLLREERGTWLGRG
jgi:hypothetical protein